MPRIPEQRPDWLSDPYSWGFSEDGKVFEFKESQCAPGLICGVILGAFVYFMFFIVDAPEIMSAVGIPLWPLWAGTGILCLWVFWMTGYRCQARLDAIEGTFSREDSWFGKTYRRLHGPLSEVQTVICTLFLRSGTDILLDVRGNKRFFVVIPNRFTQPDAQRLARLIGCRLDYSWPGKWLDDLLDGRHP